jgi:hypothetical protein
MMILPRANLFGALVVVSAATACKQAPPDVAVAPTASHEGQAFAAGTPEVAITDLLADPSSYEDKTVRLSGNVIAMCHHKRDWFALVPENGAGGNVRVLTGPVFKVPENVIGKKASAEGKVGVVEISERVARHFAEEHQLGTPADITGPVQQVVLRATGAEFE